MVEFLSSNWVLLVVVGAMLLMHLGHGGHGGHGGQGGHGGHGGRKGAGSTGEQQSGDVPRAGGVDVAPTGVSGHDEHGPAGSPRP